MSANPTKEYKTLTFASLAGICISASYHVIFNSAVVSFSFFPLVALILTIYCIHQHYLEKPMPDGTALLSAAFCLLGFLVYNVFVRSEHPELGSNLLQTFIALGLICWITYKFKSMNRKLAEMGPETEEQV